MLTNEAVNCVEAEPANSLSTNHPKEGVGPTLTGKAVKSTPTPEHTVVVAAVRVTDGTAGSFMSGRITGLLHVMTVPQLVEAINLQVIVSRLLKKVLLTRARSRLSGPKGLVPPTINPFLYHRYSRPVKEDKSEEDVTWILRNPSCLHQ